ncbi:MAG: FadR family transcriptional regulator [Cryobacterium sp.]|nr:FadR family transcriptional regulator [Cryobacterium sp.]
MSEHKRNGGPRIPKMAEVIAAELRGRILAGELRPGDYLYSEGALMEQYQVSRPTLREALRLLESQGLITVRRGSHHGPIVNLPDIQVTARSLAIQLQLRDASLGDVHAFRMLVEPTAVRLAAERATSSDIDELRKLLTDAESAIGNVDAFAYQGWNFHLKLIQMSGNAVAAVVIEALERISERHSARKMTDVSDLVLQHERNLRAHEHLVELIEQGRIQEVESYWTKHMAAVGEIGASDIDNLAITELAD